MSQPIWLDEHGSEVPTCPCHVTQRRLGASRFSVRILRQQLHDLPQSMTSFTKQNARASCIANAASTLAVARRLRRG